MKCIKCNRENALPICEICVGELLDNMNREDLIAHALVGIDAMEGKEKLQERLKQYKKLLEELE